MRKFLIPPVSSNIDVDLKKKRISILKNLNLNFKIIKHNCDEDLYKNIELNL